MFSPVIRIWHVSGSGQMEFIAMSTESAMMCHPVVLEKGPSAIREMWESEKVWSLTGCHRQSVDLPIWCVVLVDARIPDHVWRAYGLSLIVRNRFFGFTVCDNILRAVDGVRGSQ
jgi:hypothetical protein